jgi:monoamine oxidase
MFFAGEHTCFAYFGYMEGALQSGKRAAANILKAGLGPS